MKYALKALLVIFLLLMLNACNETKDTNGSNEDKQLTEEANKSEENKGTENNKTTEDENFKKVSQVDPLPSTYVELASQPVGEYVDFEMELGKPEETLETFKDLPDISSNPKQEELDLFYRELLRLVHKEFKGPEESIKQLRFNSFGDPEMEDQRYHFKENLNVIILVDASGSMANQINGKVMMDSAKDSITSFVQQLPEKANISLRVYGHKGDGTNKNKQLSCSSSELLYPITNYDEEKFQKALDKVNPAGWTPIELAINEAKKDLEKYDGKNNTNIIYLVSDGVETCDGDPVKAAKELYNSDISPIINIIGFDVDSEGENQLIEIAKETEGIYQRVNDENELKEELEKLSNVAKKWNDWKYKNLQEIEFKKTQNHIDIFVYISQEDYNATFQRSKIGLILHVFKQNGKIDPESYSYLEQKNNEYHEWIKSEIESFKEELHALNDKGYAEAIKVLEEKYKKNTQ